MDDKTIFRKVLFGGFHKDEVLAYIESLEEEKENLKLSIRDSSEKLEETRVQLTGQFQDTIQELENRLSMSEESQLTLKQQAEDLKEQTAKWSELNQELNRKLAEAGQKHLQLEHLLQQTKSQNSELHKKLADTPDRSGIYSAQLTIIKNEAARVASAQKKECENILSGLKVNVSKLIEQNRSKLANLEQELSDAYQNLSSQEAALQSLKEELAQQQEFSMVSQQLLEQKEAEILTLQQELSDRISQLEAATAFAESQKQQADSSPAESPFLSVSADPRFETSTVAENVSDFSSAESAEQLPVSIEDELDIIFSEALDSLNISEKNAQNKIIRLVKTGS